ncbi:MAG: hypothetical protein Q7T41_04255 [Candidatus Saccharibacteria bacterium]|nr:hypothetical protein [Candidatus Saccharibacteria bacterium]
MDSITLLFAILSGLIVNGTHGYLLWSQRDERKWSISTHAARDRQTHVIYLIGHLSAGLFFALFAYRFFVGVHDIEWLFWFSLIGLTFEYTQALLPARGKTNKAHAVAAYAMFISYTIVVTLAMINLDLSNMTRLFALPFLIAIPVCGIVALRKRDKFYFAQMIAISSFSILSIIYALGSF